MGKLETDIETKMDEMVTKVYKRAQAFSSFRADFMCAIKQQASMMGRDFEYLVQAVLELHLKENYPEIGLKVDMKATTAQNDERILEEELDVSTTDWITLLVEEAAKFTNPKKVGKFVRKVAFMNRNYPAADPTKPCHFLSVAHSIQEDLQAQVKEVVKWMSGILVFGDTDCFDGDLFDFKSV